MDKLYVGDLIPILNADALLHLVLPDGTYRYQGKVADLPSYMRADTYMYCKSDVYVTRYTSSPVMVVYLTDTDT